MSTRLIVRNIPKHIRESEFKDHFAKKGTYNVTDAQVMYAGTKTRQFGFVGFKTEEDAQKALKYFNGTFLHTSKIQVEVAKSQGDESIPRPWSKHTVGSSAFNRTKKGQTMLQDEKDNKVKPNNEDLEGKKQKFRDFLNVMGTSGEGVKKQNQSWNDSFHTFMGVQGAISKTLPKKKGAATEEEEKKDEAEVDQLIDQYRLFVENLSYKVNREELEALFSIYGEVEDIEIPLRKYGGGQPIGIGFIKFKTVEGAIAAYAALDRTFFQGRKIHIKPAQKKPPAPEKPERVFDENYEPKDNQHFGGNQGYSKEKEQLLKTNFDDETNWNYLFMNQDTVAASMAKKLGQTKGEFLLEAEGSMAAKVAKAETIIIDKTKEWLRDQKLIDLDALDSIPRDSAQLQRSTTVILVKNLPATAQDGEIKAIFERYGELERFLISPFNTLAIVEYSKSSQAIAAMKNLAYYKVNYLTPIYLEYAPVGFIVNEKTKKKDKKKAEKAVSESDSAASDSEENEKDKQQRQIFVKNLNFNTVEEQLEEVFKSAKIGGKVKSVKIVRRTDNQQSRGYGFVEVDTVKCAEKAVKKLQNFLLDDHALKLSLSTKKITEVETEKAKSKVLKKRTAKEIAKAGSGEHAVIDSEQAQSNKLMVKNLAFEATQEDIKELFKSYGAIRKIRLPKKVNSTKTRGFGFVEFVGPEEAKVAFKALQNTHLYNRKLVIEWAKAETSLTAQDNTEEPSKKRTKV